MKSGDKYNMRHKDTYYTYPQLLFRPRTIHIEDKLTNLRKFGAGYCINYRRGFWASLREVIKLVRNRPRNKWQRQWLHDRFVGTRIL